MEFAPYGFCHDVLKLLPQIKPEDPISFPNEWGAAARVVSPKFIRLNIKIQIHVKLFQQNVKERPWTYEISNKDDKRISYTWNDVLEMHPDYVFFYDILLTELDPEPRREYWQRSGSSDEDENPEPPHCKEEVMTQILPFVCQHADTAEGCLTMRFPYNYDVSEDIFDIFKQDSRIKFFKFYGVKNSEHLFHHKIDSISPLKLYLDTDLFHCDTMKKLLEKLLAGQLRYLNAGMTVKEIDLRSVVKIIEFFKETKGEKKFYFKCRRNFAYKDLEPYVKEFTFKQRRVIKVTSQVRELQELGKQEHRARREYTLPGTSNTLAIIGYDIGRKKFVAFEVS
ncbi:hypothetical protein L596_021491 [Steinernema carpocapsae]|uniref:DUF38 domain-containing protein n=1 Tax=Steinernema carpocapsae TaxID=34508 RepID=A0A4V5ZZZ1_STECR|nr:hypothetical protein L596_021491 [Steinernema carpocapsae]